MQRKAIFLDRDGTLNDDPGYLSQPHQMKLLPGAGEGLAKFKAAGFLLVVVSNQSGVGRGIIDAETLPAIHERLDELLIPFKAKIDHFSLCFHRPEEGCDCRKPKPKLILDASEALGIDLSLSYMIGDKESDIQAGRNAGCRGSILVLTGAGKVAEAEFKGKPGQSQPEYIAKSLGDAAQWILQSE